MKRRVLNSLLSFVLVVGLMPTPAFAAPAASAQSTISETATTVLSLSGGGTAEDPYQISTAAQLGEFRDAVNNGNATACAVLTEDITLSGSWTPIGNSSTSYQGTFDGDYHSISGLEVSGTANLGLFGYLNNATVKNVKVTGVVSATGTTIGGIAGFASESTIQNCSYSGTVSSTSGSARVGGIVGAVTGAAVTISGCANNAAVTGGYVGGILGYSNQANAITNCYNTGTITGKTRSAGIVGQQVAGTITSCFNVGQLETETGNKGGIYGFLNNGTITNCYYTVPETGSEGGTGSNSQGTKVDAVSATDLGEAFIAGTDYPVLAWENTTATPMATVFFSVNVDGATIVVNDKASNASSRRAAGSYSYTVSASGYTAATGTFTVTEEQAAAAETVTVTVVLEAKTLTSIEVAGAETECFVGDAEPALTVTAHYADGSSETVTGFTTDWDSSAAATGKVITVTYQGMTATFTCDFIVQEGPTSGLAGKADVNLKSGTYGFEEVDYDGETVLASTNKGVASGVASMTITATQAGQLSFQWKISSELRYDWLDIRVNGASTTTVKADRSGTIDWTTFSQIMAVNDVVTINYIKDSSGNTGEDTAWLRDFQFESAYTVTFETTPSNATVVLKNSSDQVVTGANGVFTVVPGTYAYSVSAFGYADETGTVVVSDTAVTKVVTLVQQASKTVAFTLTLPDGMSANDATVVVKSGSDTIAANEDGTYTLPVGDYTYTATHPDCDDATGSFTVADQDVTVPVTLERKWVISDYFAGMNVTAENRGDYGFTRDANDATRLVSNNGGKSSSTATLAVTVGQAGILSFQYDVSSELRYDLFSVALNGTKVVYDKSGEVDWTAVSVMVAAGDVLTFTYSKDSSGDRNYDCVWLKDFSLTAVHSLTLTVSPEDATVVVTDADGQAVTGTNGVYTVVPGTYAYTVSAYGYETVTDSVVVSTDDVTIPVTLSQLALQTVTFEPTFPEGMAPTASYVVKDAQGVERSYADGLPAGEYTFTAAAEGCDDVTGSFTVADAAVTVPVAFMRILTLADFIDPAFATAENDTNFPYKGVYDQEGNFLTSTNGRSSTATITVTMAKNASLSFSYLADIASSTASSYGLIVKRNGTVELKLDQSTDGWQTYSADLAAGDVLAIAYGANYSGDGKYVHLKDFQLSKLYTVDFQNAPAGAAVALTDSEGAEVAASNGTYLLTNGTYSYQLTAFGYVQKTGSFTIDDDDAVVDAAMTRAESSVITFDVPTDATVTVNHADAGVMTAEADGTYILPKGESFTYTVEKPNYVSKQGGFTVADAATIVVELEYAGDAWDGTTKTEPALVEGVYQIGNAAELAWFSDAVNAAEKAEMNAVLTANINLNGKTWTGIGKNSANAFVGTLDGQYHSINGLVGDAALFTYVETTGKVCNLTLDVNLTSTGTVGGLVQNLYGTIENCLVKGSIASSGSYAAIGGIAAYSYGNGGVSSTISNCVSAVNVSSTYTSSYSTSVNVGGIAGTAYGLISNCYAIGTVSAVTTGAANVAGLVGNLTGSSYSGSYGTLVNCYFAGTMASASSNTHAAVGTAASGTSVNNCYYLADCGATDTNAAAKTADQLAEPKFVAVLNGAEGTSYNQDTASINKGYPVLVWQGGTPYVDPDIADVAAVKDALVLAGAKDGQPVELSANDQGAFEVNAALADSVILPTAGEADVSIAWASSDAAAINVETGALTFPQSDVAVVTLTATLTKGMVSQVKEFQVELQSAAYVEQQEVNALAAKLNGKQMWAQQLVNPEVETAVDALGAYLDKNGYDLQGAQISFVNAGEKAYPAVGATEYLAEDGTITFFSGIEELPYCKYAQYNNVTFQVAKGDATATFAVRMFIGWERAAVQRTLNAAATSLTWDSIKPEGVANGSTFEDLNEGYEEDDSLAMPTWFVDCDGEEGSDNAPIADGTVLLLPATVGTCSIEWSANSELDNVQLVTFEETWVDSQRMVKATIHGTTWGEQDVVLYGMLTYNLLNEGEQYFVEVVNVYNEETGTWEPKVDESGKVVTENIDTIYGVSTYTFTVAQGSTAPVDREATQKALEEKYEGLITDFSVKTHVADLGNVADDLQMPIPSVLEDAGILEDRDHERVTMTSGDEEHLVFYGYHAMVYRPLPGQVDVTVPYTVTISDRTSGETLAEATFQMTIKALTQDEIATAAAFMTRVATDEVYWNGIAYEGADKADVNQNLLPFSKITADAEGNLVYLRGNASATTEFIELDDLPGYDPMSYGQTWRVIRSSNENVFTCENLLYTQPQYDTEVTLDSCLSYTKYAKYWEKFGLSDDATEDTKAAYAAFEQFYKVPVSATVTVKGTDGPGHVDPAEDANVTFTMSLDGKLATTAQGEVAAALPVVVKDLDENGVLTYDEAMVAAHTAYAPNGADDYVNNAGWVTKLWGTTNGVGGFVKNNAFVDNLTTVEQVAEGDVLYAFNYVDDYYGDSFTYFSDASATVEAKQPLEVQLNGIGYDSEWSLVSGPLAGAQLGYVSEQGFVALEGAVTDAEGKASVTFPKAGTYVLTAQHAERDITAPYCIVTVKAPALTEVEAPVAAKGLVYNGKSQTGVAAAEGYTVEGGAATDAGDYTATATLAEGYVWSDGTSDPKQISWSIAKAKQAISVSKVIAATNYNGTLSRLVAPLKSVAAQGELSYSKVSGATGLTVVKSGADAGKVKVAAKTAVGTYSVTIRVKAAATDNYEAATRDVAVSVKVSRFTPTISITGKVVRAVNYSKTKDKTVACPITKIQCASKPMTYELSSAKDAGGAKVTSMFAVDAATGAVTVKAGTAKGAYTVNIKVMSDDNENYRGNYKVVPCTVKVV